MSKWQAQKGSQNISWRDKSPQYPWRAVAQVGKPGASEPDVKLFGDYASVGSQLLGWRLWGFKTKEARDLFVARYGAEAGRD